MWPNHGAKHAKMPKSHKKLDLGVMVSQNDAQYSPYHVTYAPAKFEAANGSGDAFTRKYIT